MEIVNEFYNKYNIEFCDSNITELFFDIKDYYIIIDKRVKFFHDKYLEQIIKNANDVLVIECKEEYKNQDTVNIITNFLFENNASRNSTLVSIGGGICGDICGYVASIYKRGMQYISVPTTLLSQVDSSVGGKVGINYNNQKNAIGAINFPGKVIIDNSFLNTLTTRQVREGLAEIIKHGLLVDKSILIYLEKYQNIEELRTSGFLDLIKLSIVAKNSIVTQDVNDTGIRHILNYGHSFAHAIELKNDLYHGECVTWGILVATYGTKLYAITKSLFEKHGCIKKIENFDLSLIANDKKTDRDYIKEVYLQDINEYEIREVLVKDLIADYNDKYTKIIENIKYTDNLYKFNPTSLNGSVIIPPSKSYMHRYLLASALSKNPTKLTNVTSLCDDVLTTVDALKLLNTIVSIENNQVTTNTENFDINTINMKESGTSLRLMLPVLMHYNEEICVRGEGRLVKRPLQEYFKIFDEQKIPYEYDEEFLPLKINGKIQPGIFNLEGNISSQFISGLLFLLPLLDGDSTINLSNKLESLPYVKLTINTLRDFGIEIDFEDDYSKFYIKGNQEYVSKGSYEIEQDYSARNFFEVAREFTTNDINIENKVNDTLQGDSVIAKIIKNRVFEVDISDIPDAALILAVLFTTTGGTIHNVSRLQYKESNRLDAMIDFLDKMEITHTIDNNSIRIEKGQVQGGFFNTYNDHRVAMALIVASTIAKESVILEEINSINKSFPTFIECYELLGGFVDEE